MKKTLFFRNFLWNKVRKTRFFTTFVFDNEESYQAKNSRFV